MAEIKKLYRIPRCKHLLSVKETRHSGDRFTMWKCVACGNIVRVVEDLPVCDNVEVRDDRT